MTCLKSCEIWLRIQSSCSMHFLLFSALSFFVEVRNRKNIKPSLPKDKQQPVEASTRKLAAKPSSGKVQKAGGGNTSSVYPAEKLRLGI